MAKKKNQRTEERLARLRQDYETRKEEIGDLGYVVPGTLQKRLYSCGKPNCRCATQGALHGPYYQWTRKIDGKTVNINVDKESAQVVSDWIHNNRKLRKLCVGLEKISLAVLRITANLKMI